MENRERDNVNSGDSGRIDRSTSERKGRVESDSDADFGQNIGRSENWDSEPSRRGGSLGSSSGRSSERSGSNSSDNISDDDSGNGSSGSRH